MKTFSKKQLYLFSLLSGIMLWAGWPASGFPFILLIAFIPLLIIEEQLYQQKESVRSFAFFKHAFITALLWNLLSTWWVLNSTIIGGVLAIVLNALFMALVLWLFHIIRIRTSGRLGYSSIVILWISFEYLHLNWECSWPWLTLGNGFANYASCVQWYEFTGVLGGTFWIWICNILLFLLIKNLFLAPWKNSSGKTLKLLTPIVLFIPIIASLVLYLSYSEKKNPVSIVVVQPNIDPYNEKFSGDFKTQLNKMFDLANSALDSSTNYLVFPETALTEDLWENDWNGNFTMPFLKNYLTEHPHLSIVTGASTYKAYNKGDIIPISARKFTGSDESYDAYNTALELNNTYPLQVYHKSKLVPGVEIMPFEKVLAPLAKLAFDLGGTSGTLGTQKEPTVFYSPNSKTTIAPAICYESIYGEYLGKYVQKGAELIFIITNDGWWQDTPGYRQHLCYARLRAVEMRRSIARSANTGVSAFIDQRGTILQRTSWWQPATLKASLNINREMTFYALHGDYIGRYASILSIVIFIDLIISIILLKRKR
ncbi:MAG TPA: apolipoprotein N-acyltransferase [Bacteroidia bacterium]|nr:apolipoprotein N-acyltransferase [Bacteroidia bacterium]